MIDGVVYRGYTLDPKPIHLQSKKTVFDVNAIPHDALTFQTLNPKR